MSCSKLPSCKDFHLLCKCSRFSWRLGRSVLPRGELARRLIYDPGVRMRCELQRANGGGLQQEATSRVGRHRALRQHCVTSILAKLGVPGERAE
eukprot:1566920-Pleurochrysis_carterae.AAC.1